MKDRMHNNVRSILIGLQTEFYACHHCYVDRVWNYSLGWLPQFIELNNKMLKVLVIIILVFWGVHKTEELLHWFPRVRQDFNFNTSGSDKDVQFNMQLTLYGSQSHR